MVKQIQLESGCARRVTTPLMHVIVHRTLHLRDYVPTVPKGRALQLTVPFATCPLPPALCRLPALRSAPQAGRGGASAPSGSALRRLDRTVRKNRPLAEVIAAANAALDTRYERSLAVGFRELCARLSTAAAAAAAASTAAAAAASKNGNGSGGGVVAAGGAEGVGAGSREGQVAEAGPEAGGEDVYELLSVLRRLALWPVSVDLLRSTAVGRLAAQLKKHPNPQVGRAVGIRRCVMIRGCGGEGYRSHLASSEADAALVLGAAGILISGKRNLLVLQDTPFA